MTETCSVPLADVLSVTTDKLLSRRHVDGVYDLLRHMTGQDVYTHQLGKVADACAPALIEQHPFLADLKPPTGLDRSDLYAWLVEAERIHGEEIAVAPLPEWTHRDPIEDAADAVGADKVWIMRPPKD
ncbi:hypothetical protein ACH492_22195 [Streptomyces sp. NPDC019443]|uniref:DUF7736 domain-containing protein n=1 Tax=Streptomyces sp. NPDC019443 TaxID=3365061 RepID=UPI00378FE424